MLKRLELSGFKSFAERTVFDLTSGITAIVGPNGSGKSNIVDAIRWVLGEQSAKSLRGSGMADVLFNGTRTRKPLNLAEVSLTFDNSSELLGPGLPEVRITRRLYRDGTSEYMINDQPSRLKDIRDLLLGSGADAYSIIAQGQVDALLNSNPEERRHVFEEAAGISRFRLKRQDALKRLERVTQNLSLIDSQVDRIERQLRQAKQESGRAAERQAISLEITEVRRRRDLAEYGQLRADWDRALALETDSPEEGEQAIAPGDLRTAREEWRKQRALLAQSVVHGRETISQYSRERAIEWGNLTRFGDEAARTDAEIASLRSELAGLWSGSASAENSLALLAEKASACQALAEAYSVEAGQIVANLDSLTQFRAGSAQRLEALNVELLATLAERNSNTTRMVQAQGSITGLQRDIDRILQRRDHLRESIRQTISQVSVLLIELDEANRHSLENQKDLSEATSAADKAREVFVRLQRDLHQSGLDRESLRGRAEILEHLERSREGLASGVREVFALLDGDDPGAWNTVVGLAGEFLHVRREYAPILDLLLGERAQRLLVRDREDLGRALRGQTTPFSGRVSFLGPSSPLLEASEPDYSHGEGEDFGLLATVPEGVVALAENLARCDLPGFLDLPQILLGKSVVVTDLEAANRLVDRFPGFRLVTLAGEILEPDGTLTLGRPAADSGIVSRKAELRELREKLVEIQQREKSLEAGLARAHRTLDDADSRVETLEYHGDLVQDRLNGLNQRLWEAQSLIERLESESQQISLELISIREEMAQSAEILEQTRNAETILENHSAELDAQKSEALRLEATAAQGLDQLRRTQGEIAAKIQANESEALQIETANRNLLNDLNRMKNRLAEALARIHDLELTSMGAALLNLHGIQQVARIESKLGDLAAEIHPQSAELARLDLLLENAEREQDALQEAHNKRMERLHKMQLARQQSGIRIEALTKRCREEEGVDISVAWHELEDVTKLELIGLSVSALDKRLGDLRNRLGQMGPGDSLILAQLDQLEKDRREITLYRADLTGARAILEDILKRLDVECGRMLLSTFEEIRIQFQDLFRKLFGGGQADLVLENPNKPLDTSIDIVARPPGKEMRSLVLLSGGEKTMTVVALLLAIFRHKPSPFCLMDEVDAALDEANVGRFAGVLREFCDKTQFMLITHSKKTMSVADTLLGITMQESGVSTRVAVRIDEWVAEDAVRKAA